MSIAASIIGLALLVMIHEAGHFFVARWVGMTPRKFYLGFGPPIFKRTRGGVEYGIGSIPLGGYVKIPGMNRPTPGDLGRLLPVDRREQLTNRLRPVDAAIASGDYATARDRLLELQPELGDTRAFAELEGSLAPDAYWRQATWRRVAAIAAGPGINVLFAIVLFTILFMVATSRETRVIGRVAAASPASAAHLRKDDEILRVDDHTVTSKQIPVRIRATKGRPFTLVVRRNGHRVVVGPVSAKLTQGAYRIGIGIVVATGPGESAPAAVRDALGLTWRVTSETVGGITRLARGRDTNQVSSSVGIVRVSSEAWRSGARDFLSVLGLISLALALLNLLPVLPLDGGHIVMALLERVRGRTFSQGAYMRYAAVGFAIFAVLMYFGLRNDLFGGSG